jgi:enediyne biosynthesis protein E4
LSGESVNVGSLFAFTLLTMPRKVIFTVAALLCASFFSLLAQDPVIPGGKKINPKSKPPGPPKPIAVLMKDTTAVKAKPWATPGREASEPLFRLVEASASGVEFENKITETVQRNTGHYDYMYNGAGLAIADFDRDGLPDLFFSGNDVPNRIYRNLGGLRFEDKSKPAGIQRGGWATGVTVADVNDDGLPDIYVCYSGPDRERAKFANELYINKGNFVFEEKAAEFGIADPGYSTQAVFFDFDRDGDLDLFVLNHAIRNWANLSADWFAEIKSIPLADLPRFCNAFYRNEGNGKFTNITDEVGVGEIGFGLGVSVSDFNGDGLPDIFVANDYFIPDRLYLNSGQGYFIESSKEKFSHLSFNSMGCDAADINNDGLNDLVVLEMSPADHFRNKTMMASMDVPEFRYLTEGRGFLPQYMFNSLYVNMGGGIMSNVAHMAGVAQTDWSWAPLLADFDNDGRKDLYVTNGFVRDVNDNDWRMGLADYLVKGELKWEDYFEHLQKSKSQPIVNFMYRNAGVLDFANVSEAWGFKEPSFSHGAAWGDLDGDGDLDLVVNNIGRPAFIYENMSRSSLENNYLRVALTDGSKMNFDDGAIVKIYSGGDMQMVENRFTRGFQSYCEPVVHFGLGEVEKLDSLVVLWSSGTSVVIPNPPMNQTIRLDFMQMESWLRKGPMPDRLVYDITDALFRPPVLHRENPFNDFEKEVLLPHKMSQLGPALAVGDVNGDGLPDFYAGGAKSFGGVLYTQNNRGFFDFRPYTYFHSYREGEDLGALFFDANGDGKQDLYVARGGGGDVTEEALLRDLLYLNDGQGNLTAPIELPTGSTKAAVAFDWDGDGDLDLFVGGRNTPGRYPESPRSYLFVNEKGAFVDRTSELCSELMNPGMVTAAIATDITGNGKKSLMIAGEWMEPMVFSYHPKLKKFVRETLQINRDGQPAKLNGWWHSVAEADLNGDGLPDYLLGNIGQNNKFHPTPDKPLYLFANDMDDNGTLDIVLSKTYQDRLVPVRGRECSSAQMPFIEQKMKTYSDFASASLIDIYGKDKIKSAIELRAETMESAVLMNRGNGVFDVIPLPREAQVSPIMGFVSDDVNADGKIDLIIGGNFFPTEPETTPYDAGKGLLLLGDGTGHFIAMPNALSGVFLPGDIRSVLPISLSADRIPAVIAATNSGRIRVMMTKTD